MGRRVLLWGLLLALGVWFGVRAEVAVPALSGRVVDQAQLFSAEDVRRIEAAIVALELATGGQMVVWTVPALDGDPIENVGIRAADKWKVGNKGKDDGAILVIAPKDRKSRLEIGYGWEGPVNDARAGDILRGMGDYFRDGRYGAGAVYAVDQVQSFVTGKPAAASRPQAQAKASKGGGNPIVGLVITFICVLTLGMLISRGRRGGGGRGGRGGGYWGGGGGGFGGFGRGGGGGGGSFGGGGGGGFGGGGASGRW